MLEIINKIPYKKLRVFLKTHIFHKKVATEMLDKVEADIIDILEEVSLPFNTRTSAWNIINSDPKDRLALKQAIKERLLRKSQPSTFLTSVVYPILASIITTLVVSRLLHWS